MASTTFSYGTVIASTWLNDVNAAVYTTLPTLAPRVNAVLQTPTLVTPVLGVATATSINKNSFTQPATNCTWTLADGKTLTVSNTLTLNGTDGATLTLGSGASSVSGTNTGDQLTFKTVRVSGQTDVLARNTSDVLTIAAGSNITLTTDATNDIVTIAGAVGGSMVLLGTANVTTSVANIDFLNVFTSAYDKYIIEIQNLTSLSAASWGLQFAKAGVVDTAANVAAVANTHGTALNSFGSIGILAYTGTQLTVTIEIRNVNSTAIKSYSSRGFSANGTTYTTAGIEGIYIGNTALSGIRLQASGVSFSGGIVRIYGIKNS